MTTTDTWTIDLVDCTRVILEEIDGKTTMKSVGLTYAMAMRSETRGADLPDWATINAAILHKWGLRGLKRIKARAWRLIEGKEQP